jgi:putative inorganic carbon (hco3(-)) transporter
VGFALTVIYIVLTIISPEQFGAEWATYHVMAYVGVTAVLLSLPAMFRNMRVRSSIQTLLLLAFIVAIALSELANGWFGGVFASWATFLPSAAIFIAIVGNVTTIRRLKIITLAAVASCLVVVVEALCGYYGGFRGDTFVLQQSLYSADLTLAPIGRLRGAGFLSDPNDFAQILIMALPLIYLAWRRGRGAANYLLVLVPSALLLWAVYLTHSRGGLVALAVVVLVAIQKKLGRAASVGLAVALVLGMFALNFTGGRAIGPAEGADRLEAWSVGLQLFKSAPLFGTGFGSFTDFSEITAHNSFVLCLAELGLVGSTIWLALLVTTMTSLNGIIKRREGTPTATGRVDRQEYVSDLAVETSVFESLAITTTTAIATEVETEIETEIDVAPEQLHKVPTPWVVAMRLALVGFIATSWFLSRTYSTPMYLILGLAAATIALQRPPVKPHRRGHFVFYTLVAEAASVVCVYGMVLFSWLS